MISSAHRRCSLVLMLATMCALLFLLTGCGGKKRAQNKLPSPPPISSPTEDARNSPPPSAAEAEAQPDARVLWSQTGLASWYGPPYHNRRGANGEIFDTNAMTAAHKTLPMNSVVRVTNLKTKQSAVLRITDRGPFIGDRIIDLSMAAAKQIDLWRAGVAKVRVDVLETPAAIETGGRWCVQVGAFTKHRDAIELKEKLLRRYSSAKVIEFPGPTGYWVRVRPLQDDKKRAQEIAQIINVDEGGVFLVRMD